MPAILYDYSFITVVIGASILAIATAIIGTVTVLTKQSLIGDTLSHASYPGIIFAFLVFESKNPLVLTLGAMLSAYVAYYMVEFIVKQTKHTKTNALALVAAAFFGLGMILKTLSQGYHLKSAQAGLAKYIFGQAAFIKLDDVYLISFVSCLVITIYLLLFNHLKLYLFDMVFATTKGLSVNLIKHLINFMTISLIAVGLKLVGAILIASFLIAPAITGLIWSKSYPKVLVIAISSSLISVFLGTLLSSIYKGFSTGPLIIVLMSSLAIISFLIKEFLAAHTKKKGR